MLTVILQLFSSFSSRKRKWWKTEMKKNYKTKRVYQKRENGLFVQNLFSVFTVKLSSIKEKKLGSFSLIDDPVFSKFQMKN